MREIKFRAWYENEMHENVAVVDGKAMRRGYFATDIFTEFWQKSILMQLTGLLDKNGKEIYEGDIVKTPVSISVVEFDKGLFGLNHDYGTDNRTMLGSWGSECNLRCLYDGYHRQIEIIGNIYETPDLIK